jgi:general stress protein 26
MRKITFNEIRLEIQSALLEQGHPMRLFYLATQGSENTPKLRTVVLRRITDPLHVWFYTDQRSPKVEEIRRKPQVSALFYHPQKKLQVVLYGVAEAIADTDLQSRLWNELPPHAHMDYQGISPPGARIAEEGMHNHRADPALGNTYFQPVVIRPVRLDVLQLDPEGHIRFIFEPDEREESWKGIRVQS